MSSNKNDAFGSEFGDPGAFTDEPTEAISLDVIRLEAELRAARENLRTAGRWESLGQLAAGIAHDINTPVQFVGDSLLFLETAFEEMLEVVECAQSLIEKHATPEAKSEFNALLDELEVDLLREDVPIAVRNARAGVGRLGGIVKAVKAFSHPDGHVKTVTDLNLALENTIVVSHGAWIQVAAIEKDFGQLPLIPCFPGELNQVFLNLVINATHAIEDAGRAGEGVIKVSSECDGSRVIVKVSDNGTGIPREIWPKIFGNFFSTKGPGRGTGQGLPISRTIVERHGGTIDFETSDAGTTFLVCLPIEDSEESTWQTS